MEFSVRPKLTILFFVLTPEHPIYVLRKEKINIKTSEIKLFFLDFVSVEFDNCRYAFNNKSY